MMNKQRLMELAGISTKDMQLNENQNLEEIAVDAIAEITTLLRTSASTTNYHEFVKELRDQLQANLTSDQIETAQQLAHNKIEQVAQNVEGKN